jgi:hypothetical protein
MMEKAARSFLRPTVTATRHVAEMALAYAIGDRLEAAYCRGDLFEKRRRLMADWATFCGRTQPKGGVVGIGRNNAS